MASDQFTLSINTSTSSGQIMLSQEKKVIDSLRWGKERTHSDSLNPLFSQLMGNNKLKINQIRKINCVVGPGSFTGLRVAINFSRSLAYSLAIPIQPIRSLDLMALTHYQKSPRNKLICLMDAQKNTLFFSAYEIDGDKITKTVDDRLLKIESLNQFVDSAAYVVGENIEKYIEHMNETVSKHFDLAETSVNSMDLHSLVGRGSKLSQMTPVTWDKLIPIYLKGSAPEELLKPTSR